VLGGYTTFSAFSLDALALWERGAIASALGYVLASVLLSLLAVGAGHALGQALGRGGFA
jgi:CrcB protein